MPINIDWNASAYFPPQDLNGDTDMTNEELTQRIKEARDESIAMLLHAARRLEAEPDNPEHINQINYCARNYSDAQMILNPRFFG